MNANMKSPEVRKDPGRPRWFSMAVTGWPRVLLIFVVAVIMVSSSAHGLTIGEERKVGEKLLYMVRKQFRLFDDPDIAQYLNRLGAEILEVAGPSYYRYHFFLIKEKEFNAFAAPSGLVFLFSGLVETMGSEDELVSVMAHEVGHVISRHLASRLEKNRKIGIGTMALALGSLAVGNPALSQGLLAGSLAAGQTLSLRFSRLDEEEADRLSFSWMRAMHRNPRAMEGMLRTMRRVVRYRMGGEVPPYLLTHPEPEARLFYVQSLLDLDDKQHEPGYYRVTDDFDFLRMKYRLLAEIKDAPELRKYYAALLSSPNGDDLHRSMARYGQALMYAGELRAQRAVQLLEQVRAELPGHGILLADEGRILLQSGDTDRALDLLSRARQQDGTDLYTAFHLARALVKKNRLARAEELYLEVAAGMPRYSRVYFELGRVRSSLGRTAAGHLALAQYHLYEGRMEQAKRFLERVMDDHAAPAAVTAKAEEIMEKIRELEKEG